jgi:hypothetical protein
MSEDTRSAPVRNNPGVVDPDKRYKPSGFDYDRFFDAKKRTKGLTLAEAQELLKQNDPDELQLEIEARLERGSPTSTLIGRRERGLLGAKIIQIATTAQRAEAAKGRNPPAGVHHASDVHKQGQGANAYTRYIQGLLLERMPEVIASYSQENKVAKTTVNIHRLKDDVATGPYVGKISHGEKDCGISGFLHATPAQLGHLMPLLRFYIVDQKGNKQEIYFSDHSSEKRIKQMADIRAQGTLDQALTPRDLRGSNVGIKSFTWNYNNKHEGDRIIEANLDLYFGDLTDLASGNYLEMLFTSGEEDFKAGKVTNTISDKKVSTEAGGVSEKAQKKQVRKTYQQKLEERIKKQKDAISSTPDINAAVKKYKAENMSRAKKAFRQVMVVTGWSVPKGSEKELRKTFIEDHTGSKTAIESNKKKYDSFMEGVKNTQRAILLNLADYNVSFDQNGTSTLSMKYIGSTDNYLATNSSDIFGSSNDVAGGRGEINSFFEDTEIVLTDVNDSLGDRIRETTNKDPYLSKCSVRTNLRSEGIIIVSLAGLDFANDLVKAEIQLLEATNGHLDSAGNETKSFEILKNRQIVIDRLRERALNKRLKDLYSGFLRNLIGGKSGRRLLRRGLLVVKDVNKSQEIKLHLNLVDIEDRERKKEFEKMIGDLEAGASGGASSDAGVSYDPAKEPDPTPSETFFYYMRLGDILTVAMENAGFRDDISVVLGNTNILSGASQEIMSIYDIPITLGTFGQFFYDYVVQRQVKVLPFRTFFNQFLKVVANVLNRETQFTDRINFDYTVVTSYHKTRHGVLSNSALEKIGSHSLDPLTRIRNTKYKAHHYYTLFVRRISHKNRRGNRTDDECTGVYHYVVGSDRGVAKRFNFSRQNVKYFQEQLIESNNQTSKVQALFLPQNVSIDMYGNGLHRNGDLIFVDSRAALGTYASEVLGIGGYYRVIRSNHTITPQGYNTKLDCVFELRVTSKKKTKKQRGSD